MFTIFNVSKLHTHTHINYLQLFWSSGKPVKELNKCDVFPIVCIYMYICHMLFSLWWRNMKWILLFYVIHYIPERVITIDAQQPSHLNNNVDSTLMQRLIKYNSQWNHKRELKLTMNNKNNNKKQTHTHQHSIFQHLQTTMTSRSIGGRKMLDDKKCWFNLMAERNKKKTSFREHRTNNKNCVFVIECNKSNFSLSVWHNYQVHKCLPPS